MATKAETPDTRNLEWRENNVGSALLQKMGWKQGQALGSKHRKRNEEDVSGEGLRITKRRAGLGLGGDEVANNAESTSHASFSQLLVSLKQQHPGGGSADGSSKKKRKSGSDDDKSSKKKKKKSKKETVFASNKITNSRVRQSKFTTKSAEEMACIFGEEFSSAEIIATQQKISREEKEKRARKERKKEKKRKKEDREDDKDSAEEGSSADKQERKRKRKEEKKRKKREKTREE